MEEWGGRVGGSEGGIEYVKGEDNGDMLTLSSHE